MHYVSLVYSYIHTSTCKKVVYCFLFQFFTNHFDLNKSGVGNIPANMNPGILRTIFQPFGGVESVRVLSHKNCGFVNFEQQQDAVRARKTLQNKEILGPGTGAVRIGFAKAPVIATTANVIPPPSSTKTATATVAATGIMDEAVVDDRNSISKLHATLSAASMAAASPDTYQATQWAAAMMMSSMMKGVVGQQHNAVQSTAAEQPTSLYAAIAAERRFIMQQLDHEFMSAEDVSPGKAKNFAVKNLLTWSDLHRTRKMSNRLNDWMNDFYMAYLYEIYR